MLSLISKCVSILDATPKLISHQHAAGCFAHLADEVVSTVRIGPNEPSPCSPDFSAEALKALENLCLAQAQECFWQKAVLGVCSHSTGAAIVPITRADRLKNGTIAKLSARVAELYTLALESAQAAKGAGGTWPAFSLPQVRSLAP